MSEPRWTADYTTLYEGDSRQVLPTLPARTYAAVVTDPPYELGFMGKSWDRSGIANDVGLWREVLRVLKPGGHLLAFGGTRTYHRMVCAIEDAGFEIRDTLCWLYGSGFPKSLSVSKALDRVAGAECEIVGINPRAAQQTGQRDTATHGNRKPNLWTTAPATDLARQWDGWGTALKPAHEPIVLARAPLSEPTVAANVARWGTGALNIDGGRLGAIPRTTHPDGNHRGTAPYRGGWQAGQTEAGNTGRWPPNVALSHTLFCEPVGTRRVASNGHYPAERGVGGLGTAGHRGQANLLERHTDEETVEAWACAEGCPVRLLDEQSGERKGATSNSHRSHGNKEWVGSFGLADTATLPGYADIGGASRFFYVAKASAAERSRGLPDGERNSHPTVKPLALMRWLLTLVTPPGGVVLDPFAGSGSTLVAAAALHIQNVGIEQDPSSCHTAIARLGGLP